MQEEIWKDIPGYEGYYQASNLGNIRSVERVVFCRPGVQRKVPSKVLAKNKAGNGGYYRVMISIKGKVKYVLVHILVALSFVDNPENKEQVNHINGNKLDNRAENLEWVTQSENMLHAYNLGLQKPKSVKPRRVICVDTGEIFNSILSASESINRSSSTLRQAIRENRPCGGFKYEYC